MMPEDFATPLVGQQELIEVGQGDLFAEEPLSAVEAASWAAVRRDWEADLYEAASRGDGE